MGSPRKVAPTVYELMVAHGLSMGMGQFQIRRALEVKYNVSHEESLRFYKAGKDYYKNLTLNW